MDVLNDLRSQLTVTQRTALSLVWQHRLEQHEWIAARALHQRLGKQAVISALSQLGGGIVRTVHDAGKERYQLTFLGVLLTEQGEAAEQFMVRYLEYLRDRFAADPNFSVATSKEVEAAFGLTHDESQVLHELIEIGNLWGDGAGFGGPEWHAGVPNDIDDFVDIRDFHEYLRRRAMADFDPALPVSEAERVRYAAERWRPANEFEFIKDSVLRQQLADDWQEAQRAFRAEGWKSCVILCGGILEGMLLDAVRQDERAARQACLELRRDYHQDLSRWTLVDLVDVAERITILQKGTAHLSHGLREYRNLVHPARQIRLKITITENEANIALGVIKATIKELSRAPNEE